MRRSAKATSFDGSRIAYRVWGAGSAKTSLLCFSGIACDEVYWVPLAKEISKERQVLTWDYPYHGDSGPAGDPEAIDVSSLARHAQAFIDKLEIGRFVLVGHSMGVQVMLEYYRANAAKVAAMISIAGPYQHTVGHLYGTNVGHSFLTLMLAGAAIQPGIAQILWKFAVNPQVADPLGRLGGLIGRAPTEVMARYFKHLGGIELVPLLKMFQAGQEHSAEDLLEKIDVPFLILHGTNDVMTPLSLAEEMSKRIPTAEMVAFEGGAHTLPAEDPESIQREIRHFLKKRVDS